MRFTVPTFSIVALLLVSGCVASSGSPAAAHGASASPSAEPARFSETTGAIQGLVVDDAFQPVAGALIGIRGSDAATSSDASGAFTFNDLAPGRYVLDASALGHEAASLSVDVTAGAIANARFTLPTLAVAEPYVDLKTFAGLIECGWGVTGAGSGNCLPIQFLIQQFSLPNPTSTRIIGLFPIEDPEKAKGGVFELSWNPSAATTSGQLLLTVELENTGVVTGKTYASSQGPNPVRVVTGDQPYKDLKPDAGANKVQTRTFPAGTTPPTLVANQRFTVYASTCYIENCPSTYSALRDQ